MIGCFSATESESKIPDFAPSQTLALLGYHLLSSK